mgnify:CR=1 FL=1
MKLIQVRFKNFMSYGSELQTLPLSDLGLTLLSGSNNDGSSFNSNGSGKSSLIETIVYSLYGKLSDGTSGDSIINRQSGKDTYVELTLSVGTHTYVIKRYRKNSKFKNKTLLFEDDEEITKSSIKLTNEEIQRIVGIDLDTYLHSVFFGMGNVVPFTQANDKQKKEILEDAANIAIYKQAQLISKDRAKALKNEIEKQTNQKDLIKSNLDYLKSKQSEHSSSLKQLENSIADSYNKIDNLKQFMKSYHFDQDKYQKLVDSKNKLLASLDDIKFPDTTELQQKVNKIGETYYQLSATYKNQYEKYQEYFNNLKDLKNAKTNVCVYCGSVLDEVHRKKEIANLSVKLDALVANLKKIKPTLDKLKPILIASKSKLADMNESTKRLSETQSKVKLVLNKVISAIDAMQDKKNQYDGSHDKLNQYQDFINQQQHSLDLAKNNDNQLEIDKVSASYSKVANKLNKDQSLYDQYTDLVNIYSDKGVKAHVLSMLMPYLNDRTNYYLGFLADGTINVKISPYTTSGSGNTSEKINIEVTNLNGSSEYEHNSRGERQRIDLAISLALQDYVLSQTNVKTNLIAYDEVFDGLDNIGIDRLMSLLKDRVKEVPTIIVVSHNEELKSMFENIIRITKHKGISSIEKYETD